MRQKFRDALEKIATAKGVLVGVPSDVGAGFRRGANLGPQAHSHFGCSMTASISPARGVVDLGDVFVVPQLLPDEMLSEAQLSASRTRGVPGRHRGRARAAAGLTALHRRRVFELVFQVNPKVKPFVLEAITPPRLPPVQALASVAPQPWGIVQSDAHTDLLETRLGVKYCFATWSWHANELLGRQGRLTQVGIRASGRDRAHWESTLGVRQFWAKDVLANPQEPLDALLAHVKSTGVKGVYFSNDIDGTDAKWADATGTPEPAGLEPDWVVELIRRLGREVGLLGGDVMEVAPGVTPTPESAPRTVGLAVRYLRETVEAALPR